MTAQLIPFRSRGYNVPGSGERRYPYPSEPDDWSRAAQWQRRVPFHDYEESERVGSWTAFLISGSVFLAAFCMAVGFVQVLSWIVNGLRWMGRAV